MSKNKRGFDFELFFRALADRTRLRLLNLMGKDEICVCFFVDVIGTNQPKVSRHLAYLRRAGITSARRDGKWMYYKVVMPPDEGAAKILQNLLDTLATDPEMQTERAQILNISRRVGIPKETVQINIQEQKPAPELEEQEQQYSYILG